MDDYNQNLNYNNIENNSNPTKEKYAELVDHRTLKKYSKLYFYLALLHVIFIIVYIVRWLFGLSYFNPTPDDLLENILSRKIPLLNTINCTEINYINNPIIQNYPIKELPKHKSYTRMPVESNITKICGTYLVANFAKNATFSHSCNETIFFRETECPVSKISGSSIAELIYDPQLIVNLKGEKIFVYKQKIIAQNPNCEFINEIDPQFNSFLLPFFLLIPIGFGAFLQCVFGGICLEKETKDDLSRPPLSSTSETSYQKVGEIHTYAGGNLIRKKDWKDYVTTVRYYYHQINKTGKDYLLEIVAVLIIDAIVVGICFYYAKIFYFFQKYISLVNKMGNDKCFENSFYNERFGTYADGMFSKAQQMGIAIGVIGIANGFCFILTITYVIWKIFIKKICS